MLTRLFSPLREIIMGRIGDAECPYRWIRDVMVFAGWNSTEMMDGYDTRDRIQLAERAKEIVESVGLTDTPFMNRLDSAF
jgi:hypothetical protein